jgi:hypothetical protein
MSVYRFLTLCGTVGLLLIFCSGEERGTAAWLAKADTLAGGH